MNKECTCSTTISGRAQVFILEMETSLFINDNETKAQSTRVLY